MENKKNLVRFRICSQNKAINTFNIWFEGNTDLTWKSMLGNAEALQTQLSQQFKKEALSEHLNLYLVGTSNPLNWSDKVAVSFQARKVQVKPKMEVKLKLTCKAAMRQRQNTNDNQPGPNRARAMMNDQGAGGEVENVINELQNLGMEGNNRGIDDEIDGNGDQAHDDAPERPAAIVADMDVKGKVLKRLEEDFKNEEFLRGLKSYQELMAFLKSAFDGIENK